ncbi:conserved hypothetical protein [Gloeothece citriformis PCC 7424]|uniref:Uncharacterized protein n=1 Tax=Gloeothece citriformis (strain PCC 7424) TaxID=65393 RepID=B7KBA8_GLOC7|nr:hypothetical protein [Gloeothece citriformis]ACK71464.1 conserved hypothetical protein [Gloeothece citriformis PCC 7424]
MDKVTLKNQVKQVQTKREFLVQLLDRPDLGTLRIDINQAIEELDELIEEFKLTFPEENLQN